MSTPTPPAAFCPKCGSLVGHTENCPRAVFTSKPDEISVTVGDWSKPGEPPAADDNLPKGRGADSVCRICGDTHVMDHGDRQVACTFCPTPCQLCRGLYSAYCTKTPCGCDCHALTKPPNTPEPAPKPGTARATWSLVMADMLERDAAGAAKYGIRHQHDNGRDHLVDLYQELLDAALYVRAEIEQRKAGAR